MNAPTTNLERASLTLEGLGEVDLAAISAEEGLSALFRYQATCRLAEASSPDALLGREAAITLRDGFGGERTITGIVAEAELTPRDDGHAALRLIVRPRAFLATLGRDCRTFRDLDVVGLAREILGQAGIAARFELVGSYPVREYTAQYRESDWDFLCRLFEEEGIFYWFDHEEGSTLVIADRSGSAPDTAGGAAIDYRPESGLQSPGPHLTELGGRSRVVTSKIALASFDPTRPSFKPQALSGGDGLEYYDAPGASPGDPKVLEARAAVRREAYAARAAMVRGRSPCVRLAPGRAFELSGHTFPRLDRRYVVTALSFTVESIGFSRSGDQRPIDLTLRAIPANVPFRPLPVTPVPRHVGLQVGVVIGPGGAEIHPDDAGRVRMEQRWDRNALGNDQTGRWVRVAQRGTAGSLLLPRIGWNVLSKAEEGSVDLPVVMSRTFDGEHPPPYPLPDNKTRVAYRTATSPGGGSFNEIRFEDRKGAEEMFVNSTRDLNVLVKNDKQETVHASFLHEIGVNHTLEVGTTLDAAVEGDQTVKIGGNQSEEVGGARAKLVEGNEKIVIGAGRKYESGANLESASTSRSVQVGAAQIELTLGAVQAAAPVVSTLVGGVVLKASPRKLSEAVGTMVTASTVTGKLPAGVTSVTSLPGVSGVVSALSAKIPSVSLGAAFQTIGGAKLELGLERIIRVKKSFTERVLGMMLLRGGAKVVDEAEKSYELGATALCGKGKTISIESAEKVELKCGATTLTVSAAEGITLSAPSIELSGAALLSATAPDGVECN